MHHQTRQVGQGHANLGKPGLEAGVLVLARLLRWARKRRSQGQDRTWQRLVMDHAQRRGGRAPGRPAPHPAGRGAGRFQDVVLDLQASRVVQIGFVPPAEDGAGGEADG